MKKYLLGLLAIPFSLIAFSNAVNINLTCEGQGDCSPSPFYKFENSYNNLCFNFNTQVYGEIYNDDFSLSLPIAGETVVCGDIPAGTVNFYHGVNSSETYVISFNLPGDDNTGGGNEGGNEGGGIVTGGINAFSGIITKLGDIFGEFGPYIIYIAIACIGISLLFKALKNLLGFTDGKAKNSIGGRSERGKIQGKTRLKYATMKSRRTYRRRLRRKNRIGKYKLYKNNNNNENQLKFGKRGYNSRK